MFNQLQDKLLASIKKLKGQGRISESNIDETLREIKLNLLEADVHFKVVKNFIDRVKQKSLGAEVLNTVSPGQQFIKIVHDELVQLLGGASHEINLREKPSILMMVGLQGTGKTTTTAKLALHIQKTFKKRVGLVPADIYRPAAIDQLKVLGEKIGAPVFPSQSNQNPRDILKQAKEWAQKEFLDVLILDTAGRLQIDEDLMTELSDLKTLAQPQEILLVVDAMLGQQSVNVAQGFNEKLGLSGFILTKVDGDARGGAALSIREMTGLPIKFLGQGEKVEALEVFHPDRLASRILDMGDVVSLVEKAQEVINEEDAIKTAKKIAKNEFTVEDFLSQMQQIKKLGSFESIMKMLPGMNQVMKQVKDIAPPDKEIKKIEAIIRSMTLEERQNHKILNGSRRLRIAKGSGTQVSDVNKFIKQFEQSQKMMSQMMKFMGKGGGFPGMGGGGGFRFPF